MSPGHPDVSQQEVTELTNPFAEALSQETPQTAESKIDKASPVAPRRETGTAGLGTKNLELLAGRTIQQSLENMPEQIHFKFLECVNLRGFPVLQRVRKWPNP